MKIAILTQPLGHNYGGILQAFAMQKIIRSMGHQAYTVDFRFPSTWYYQARSLTKTALNKYIKRLPNSYGFLDRPTLQESEHIRKNLIQFVNQNIKLTNRISEKRSLKDLKQYHFDAYLVGSDQVWRPKYSPDIRAFFLNFVEGRRDIKRIAYAASFGTDNWEFSRTKTRECSRLVSLFDGVSVREKGGVELCRRYLHVNAHHVVDPTLLLGLDDYLGLIGSSQNKAVGEQIATYILDDSDQKDRIVASFSNYMGLPFSAIIPKKHFRRNQNEHIDEYVMPGIDEWLHRFKTASFIITDSFHGAVFSIIFEKPFVVIGNIDRGISRHESLFSLLGIRDRLILSNENLNDSKFLHLDFSEIRKRLAQERVISMNFLKEHIGIGN